MLDTRTWRHLMSHDSAPEQYETLIDLASEAPLLLEKSDAAITSSTPNLSLLPGLLTVFHHLCAWQHAYKLSIAKPLYWAIPSRVHNPCDDTHGSRLFPFALEFSSLDSAIPFIFSSAVMLQILSAALLLAEQQSMSSRQQETPPSSSDDDTPHWSGLDIKREADRLARFLCQSMEYCFRHEMGTLGAQATCLPLWATASYFRQVGMKRELEWCRQIKDMDGPGLRRRVERRVELMVRASESGAWWW